jgi:hypothetical protein
MAIAAKDFSASENSQGTCIINSIYQDAFLLDHGHVVSSFLVTFMHAK